MRYLWTQEELDRAATMFERGKSYEQIAITLRGDSKAAAAIKWQILRQGAVRKGSRIVAPSGAVQQRGAHVVRRFSAEEDARLLALEAEGLSAYRIGLALGRRHNSVVGRLATLARHDAIREGATP